MNWSDPDLEWLLDDVPTCTGQVLARALCPELSESDRLAAAAALTDPLVVTATVRMVLDDVADLLAVSEADLDAYAARIASGESFHDVFVSIPLQPGCAAGFFSDWEYIVDRFHSVHESLDRIVVTAPGQVSHVLAWDKETDAYGAPVAVEYVSQVCPRAMLPDGREAVLLPPRIAGVRTFEPDRSASHTFSRAAVPASTYVQLTGLSQAQSAEVGALGVPVLSDQAARRISVARPHVEPRTVG